MPSIPDDGTMDAALYGSAHIETALAREDGERLLDVMGSRMDLLLSRMDVELASVVMEEAPGLVYSDEEPEMVAWPSDVLSTVHDLRELARLTMASDIVASWISKADHRGRLIGLGEHSARVTLSGDADANYKAAVLRRSMP